MKKILVVILMLITTAGMVIPCCSFDDCCADRVSTSNQDKHQDEGSCSPFFTCASCPASVEVAGFIELDFPPFEKLEHHQNYLKMQPSSLLSTFWQPPRA